MSVCMSAVVYNLALCECFWSQICVVCFSHLLVSFNCFLWHIFFIYLLTIVLPVFPHIHLPFPELQGTLGSYLDLTSFSKT